MNRWYTFFRHPDQLPGIPTVTQVFRSSYSESYHGRGKDRQDTGYAFQYTVSGEGIFKFDGEEYPVSKGMAFFRRVNDPKIEYYFSSDSKEPWEVVFCDFESEGFEVMAEGLCKHFGHVFHIDENDAFIQSLLSSKTASNEGKTLSISENMMLITQFVSALSNGLQVMEKRGQHPTLEKALRLIYQADLKSINVSHLAQDLAVSREHLARLFKKELGQSPHYYINEQRLETAKKLLRSSDMKVQDIALHVGVGREQFSYWFRKQLGQSPSEYRKS